MRAELMREALVDEWFISRADGFEQGWTIAEPTNGADRITIQLEFDGLQVQIVSPTGAKLVDHLGQHVLWYKDLAAFDAAGQELEARLVGCPPLLTIEVLTPDASFPITIDPLITPAAWTYESDISSSTAGTSVSTAGDLNGDGYSDVVIGLPGFDSDRGRAIVFYGSPTGLSNTPDWTSPALSVFGDRFGQTVSCGGDLNGDGFQDMIVAAPGASGGAGRVFVFMGSADGLAGGPSSSTLGIGGGHGSSIAWAGDVNDDGFDDIIVGAPTENGPMGLAGRASVYPGGTGGLSSTPIWTVAGLVAGDRFGEAVSSAGDIDADGIDDFVVGAPGEGTGGAVYIYLGGSPSISTTDHWKEFGFAGSDYGAAISRGGEFDAGFGLGSVLVGSPEFLGNGGIESLRGTVPGISPLGQSVLASLFGVADAIEIGAAVTLAGDFSGQGRTGIVVGVPGYREAIPGTRTGAIAVYYGSSGCGGSDGIIVAGLQALERFGAAVSGAGDVDGDGLCDLLVGAPNYTNGHLAEGRVKLFFGSLEPPFSGNSQGLQLTDATGSADSPTSVAFAGDVNGDGFTDAIVGDQDHVGDSFDEGAAFLYLGGEFGGLNTVPAWIAESGEAGSNFGRSVAAAGDVNGDGYDDVIVGAPDKTVAPEITAHGAAFVYFGSPGGLSLSADVILTEAGTTKFGRIVSGAGDVDGDGYADILIADAPFSQKVRLFLGSQNGPSSSPDWEYPAGSGVPTNRFTPARAGDINGDGYSDILIGNWGGNEVLAFFGSPSGPSATPDWTVSTPFTNTRFGEFLGSAGDVNGDGFADVIVGAPFEDNPELDEGRVYVYLGGPGGPATTAAWTAESDLAGARFGWMVTGAGDLNLDGYGDVLIGAPEANRTAVGQGEAYVFLGSATGLSATPSRTILGTASDHVGRYGDGGGDTNGDGQSEFLVAETQIVRQRIGQATSLHKVRPRQLIPDATAPVALLGSSEDSFLIRLGIDRRGTGSGPFVPQTPVSTDKLFLEWQIEPNFRDFDPLRIGRSSSPINSASGVTVIEEEVALTGNVAYRWRARLATANPYMPHTRWVSLPGNSQREIKIRASCQDDACPLVLCTGQVCPCGNTSATGGCRNSTGKGARLLTSGTTSIAAGDLALQVTDCPPGNLGLFFVADTPLTSPPMLGDGRVCIGGTVFRFAPTLVLPNGTAVLSDPCSAAPPGFFALGESRYFQFWVRDVFCTPLPVPCPSPCGNGTNLSDALGLLFLP